MEVEDCPSHLDFPAEEVKTLAHWDEIKAFETSLKLSEGKPEFVFFDGPPFATGLPHYGHILAGTIKDVVTRYATQTGRHVTRRFGWDCHGLPVEFEIDKKLGVKCADDVDKMGIDKYNKECRDCVMRFANEWEHVVHRMGRWIDFKNDYRTMYTWYMESIWWVFRTLFDKNLVYRGFKVMPFSTGCTTPLSNFEAGQNYQDVSDPSVYVTFPLTEDPAVSLVAWTTTPWTLPANLALCVNPDFDYIKIQDEKSPAIYIVAECLTAEFVKQAKLTYKVLQKMKGCDLKDKTYTPLYNYFIAERENSAFRILVDGFVTSESGTGVVHCAPGFGEEDYRVCLANSVIQRGEGIVCPIDDSGRFLPSVTDFVGVYVKDADALIIKDLKGRGRLIASGKMVHSYPFCWRSATPLIYRAVPSWFIKVEEIKDRMLVCNEATKWVPDFVREKRFHNWIRDARDWAVSRNRYWGTPIPIWRSDDWEEIICIGSIAELEELSGVTGITDIHREFIDHITIPSRRGPQFGVLRRIKEVFDCWFESGAMPYAQNHYPFENKEYFEKNFPADFIAEGLDQTRGWFYTLLVLSTALFDRPPFVNCVVNGLVLAEDGKKMSKSLKNYPDPMTVVGKYGADAVRLYLVNSPVVRAEPLRFSESGVRDVLKDIFLPWYSAFRFFLQNSKRAIIPFVPAQRPENKSEANAMDKWIMSRLHNLIKDVRREMDRYFLYNVCSPLIKFLEDLTNWYVRLNRSRLKGSSGAETQHVALSCLYEVLVNTCTLMAPVTPYLTDYMYQRLKVFEELSTRVESVHFRPMPTARDDAMNSEILRSVYRMQAVILEGRIVRERKNVSLKTPIREIVIVNKSIEFCDDVKSLSEYVHDELNVKTISFRQDEDTLVSLKCTGNGKTLGKRLGKLLKETNVLIEKMSSDEIGRAELGHVVVVGGVDLSLEDLIISRTFNPAAVGVYDVSASKDVMIMLNLAMDEDLLNEGLAREIVNRFQKLRKEALLFAEDKIEGWISVRSESDDAKKILKIALEIRSEQIATSLGIPPLHPLSSLPEGRAVVIRSDAEIGDVSIDIAITRL